MRHCLNEGYYMPGYYQKAIDMYSEPAGVSARGKAAPPLKNWRLCLRAAQQK